MSTRRAVFLAPWLLLAAWFLLPPMVGAGDRFPQPDFDTNYTLPATPVPAPRPVAMAYVDVAVLALALGAASYLALKRRTRRGLFLLMGFCLLYFGFWRKGCVCPVGATQNVVLALADPSYAVPLAVLAFFVLPLVFALFFGRVFCAAVCPLGAAQDVVALWPVRLPRWLSHVLGLIPAIYLGAIVFHAAMGAGFMVCRMDPFVAFFRLSGSLPMLSVGACVLAVGVLVARPYCRFLCPYGVLLNWMSRFAKWRVTITPDECIQCRLCEDACPFDAIRAPTTPTPETRSVERRRLIVFLVALPLLVMVGGLTGRQLGPAFAGTHPTVRLAEQVRAEDDGETDDATVESIAFRTTGRPVSELAAEAAALRGRYAGGAGLFGGYVGLVLGLKLVGLCVRRTRRDYEPDRGECLSCGRCFAACPKEQARRKCGTGRPAPGPSGAAGA